MELSLTFLVDTVETLGRPMLFHLARQDHLVDTVETLGRPMLFHLARKDRCGKFILTRMLFNLAHNDRCGDWMLDCQGG
jgi:hypothetical protein